MGEGADDLCTALRALTDEIRAERAERLKLAENVSQLQQVVGRFVVAVERQLASGQAAQRRAERVLAGYDPNEVKAMHEQIAKRLGKR